MKDKKKTKAQLISELEALRTQVAELKSLNTHWKSFEQLVAERTQELNRLLVELKKSGERYRSLFEDSPISLWEEDFSAIKIYINSLREKGVKDFRIYFNDHPEDVKNCAAKVKIVDINKATLALYRAGGKKEFQDGLGKIFSEESYNVFKEELIAIAEGKTVFESEAINQTLTGDKIHIALRWSVAPGYEETLSKVLVSIINITELKRSQEKLREALSRFEALIENTPLVAIQGFNRDGVILHWNEASKKLYGFDAAEAIGQRLQDMLLSGESAKEFEEAVREIWGTGQAMPPQEWEVGTRTGEKRWVYSTMFPVFKYGIVDEVFCMDVDITKHKQTEEELRLQKSYFQQLFDNSPAAIVIVDKTDRVVDANHAFQSIFGYTIDEIRGRLLNDLIVPENLVEEASSLSLAALGRQLVQKETLRKRRNGSLVQVSLIGYPIVIDQSSVGVYGIYTDITEHKRLEQQLIQSQKIEAIGRLAGGIAHDFNNLLTSIIGYAEMLQMKLPSSDPIINYIKQILKATERATALTQQLLAFSRKSMLQPKILNLNNLIENFKNMLQPMLGEDITLEFLFSKDLGTIEADLNQIEQIIMNLAVNSRDAMPNGGKLIIETKNVELDENYGRKYSYVIPGRYVLLSISDTGCGMDSDTLSHIFEPFFTTKEKGSGLGLSTVYGIAKQSGGHINVYSEAGKGTTVKVYLPRVDKHVEEMVSISDFSKLPRGKETVLLVEDEEIIRELTVSTLSEFGYKVLVAKSGEDALSLWEKNAGKIDLLLTDVVMPNMSGRQLAEHLLVSKPDLKVLYMSGYAKNVISHHGIVDKDIFFIQKPFSPRELAKKIREVLDS